VRLATIGVRGPLGTVPRVVAKALDSDDATPLLIDCTAAGELWWARAGSGDPLAWAAATFPPDLVGLLRGGERGLEMVREAVTMADDLGPGATSPSGLPLGLAVDQVERLPLLRPPMLRDFYAFEGHVAAGAARRSEPIPPAWYQRPVYYKGNPSTILAPGAVVPWPAYTDALDYELELACVLLSGGQDLSPQAAGSAIAGYTVFCDFSARDLQRDEMQLRLGPAKSKDFASGLGPWLVTADEVGDPAELTAVAHLNGLEVARGRMGDAKWSFAEMVAYASGAEPLEAGEVLASGTVTGGSGQEQGRLLEPGDRVDCELVGWGTLSHTVGARHAGCGGSVMKAKPL
jgi:2-keto-4-pentenoate hydratase/2-oxohepta-3-ene-1,7-dioic acid hydratase in catechol pathway